MTEKFQSKSEESIYRFDSFEHLQDTIQRKSLFFAHHSLWNDPNEGHIFNLLKTQQGRNTVLNILKNLAPKMAQATFVALLHMDNCIHGQSWTKCEEHELLWQIHSKYDDSVRIEVLLEKINMLNGVEVYEIQYRDTTLEEDIKEMLDTQNRRVKLAPILLRKSQNFSYEQEVRLLSSIDLSYLHRNRTSGEIKMLTSALHSLFENGQITRQELETGLADINPKSIEKVKEYRRITFDRIPNFIKSVMVHPKASNEFVEHVISFCSSNNLYFVGKS